MTDNINGGQVIRTALSPARGAFREGRWILVDMGEDQHARYVTAWQGTGDSQWCHGHYFDDKGKAIADFNARAEEIA